MLATTSVRLCRIIPLALGGIVLTVSASANDFDPGESVTLEPVTGDYIVTFVGENGVSTRSVYDPANKIVPFVVSHFPQDGSEYIAYNYALKNGLVAKQPIVTFWLDYIDYLNSSLQPVRNNAEFASLDWTESLARSKACDEGLSAPATWRGTCKTSESGIRVSFTREGLANKLNGVPPGQQEAGFGFSSNSLPGVFLAKLQGNNFNWKEGGEPWPGEEDTYRISAALTKKLGEITTNAFILRNIAVPRFGVPNPFNGVPLLEKIRTHVNAWPQQQLMEQGLWRTVDGFLGGAIAALKKSDLTNAVANLAQIRVELRKKYPDLDMTTVFDDPNAKDLPALPDALKTMLGIHDQRLAAKVLDFDVDFVTRRLQVQNSAPPSPPDSDGPGVVMPPLSNTMYAPLADLNGTFTVSWSTPLLVGWFGSATVTKLDHYELQYSKSRDFANVITINAGRDLSYQLRSLAKGIYYTRVIPWIGRADNCQGCIGGGSSDEVYEAAPGEPYTGPHQTQVLVGP